MKVIAASRQSAVASLRQLLPDYKITLEPERCNREQEQTEKTEA